MKLSIVTQGCRANKADSGWLSFLARKNDFEITEEIADAEAVLINSCTVTHGADRDCRQLIR